MNTKHTPGPWFVLPLSTTMGAEQQEPGSFSIGTSANAGIANILCSRFPWPERADEMRANACLIAASPELLEALQAVVAVADRATDEFDRARAAIEKATGASHA